jgi:hypothetical protein
LVHTKNGVNEAFTPEKKIREEYIMSPKKSSEKPQKKTLLAYVSENCKTFVPVPGPQLSKKGNLYFRVISLCSKCNPDIYDTCRLRLLSETPPEYEMTF